MCGPSIIYTDVKVLVKCFDMMFVVCSSKKCAGKWSFLVDEASNLKPKWTNYRRARKDWDGASTERG